MKKYISIMEPITSKEALFFQLSATIADRGNTRLEDMEAIFAPQGSGKSVYQIALDEGIEESIRVLTGRAA